MKKQLLIFIAALVMVSQVMASEMATPIVVEANTTAVANDVNVNFTAAKTAIDDNNNRIIKNENNISTNANNIAAITPIAFGLIAEDSTVLKGSGNFSCVWDDQRNIYVITIDDVFYSDTEFSTFVNTKFLSLVGTTSDSGKLRVLAKSSTGDLQQTQFSFIVYSLNQ